MLGVRIRVSQQARQVRALQGSGRVDGPRQMYVSLTRPVVLRPQRGEDLARAEWCDQGRLRMHVPLMAM